MGNWVSIPLWKLSDTMQNRAQNCPTEEQGSWHMYLKLLIISGQGAIHGGAKSLEFLSCPECGLSKSQLPQRKPHGKQRDLH